MAADSKPLGSAHPQGVLGLNAIMVYGENLQVAVGLNHQLAIGNNLQLCINPAGLFAGAPEIPGAAAFTGMLGSGLGGNMQLTVGTSASFVWGQMFDISMGPEKIEYKLEDKAGAAKILCGILGLLTLTWTIVYATVDGDHERANEAIIFQALTDVVLMALMAIAMDEYKLGEKMTQVMTDFYAKHPDEKPMSPGWQALAAVDMTAIVVGAAVAPLVVIAANET